jgi:hypothetical protein
MRSNQPAIASIQDALVVEAAGVAAAELVKATVRIVAANQTLTLCFMKTSSCAGGWYKGPLWSDR